MGHPNVKVARASHAIFVAFISSGKDPNQEERVVLKEQLIFYYMQRSLQVFKATGNYVTSYLGCIWMLILAVILLTSQNKKVL